MEAGSDEWRRYEDYEWRGDGEMEARRDGWRRYGDYEWRADGEMEEVWRL